jgi:hypothetical protein
MSSSTKPLYERDFAEWSDRTAALIRAGKFDQVDAENVAEEIESLGRAERKAVRSQLQRLMMHKIKQQIQPERDNASWHASVRSARTEILEDLADSPSLRRHLRENLQRVYLLAARDAREETGSSDPDIPGECPWDLDALLEEKD